MINVKTGTVRRIIREEFIKGIPEFLLRNVTDECAERLKAYILKFIQSRAQNSTHQRELIAAANETIAELKEKLYADVEDKLYSFIQNT